MRTSRRLVVALVLLSLVALILPSSIAVADDVVTFTDPNLEAVIREAIEKPTGDSGLVGIGFRPTDCLAQKKNSQSDATE